LDTLQPNLEARVKGEGLPKPSSNQWPSQLLPAVTASSGSLAEAWSLLNWSLLSHFCTSGSFDAHTPNRERTQKNS